MIILGLSIIYFVASIIAWVIYDYNQSKGKRFFMPSPLSAAHFGKTAKNSQKYSIMPHPIPIPDDIENLDNIMLLKAIGHSANSKGINDGYIVLAQNNNQYSHNDMAVIKYNGALKVRKLGKKIDNKWTTLCDFEIEKEHQEEDFIGVIKKVYRPEENKWYKLNE